MTQHEIALYSDIHANLSALEAVYRDMDRIGVHERYCLGDLVGYGPHPSEAIALVRASGDVVVRGNYDDGVGRRSGGCGCFYDSDAARARGEESYAFTDAALDDSEHAYLASLPDEARVELGGLRVLMVHGSPRKLNEYLLEDRPESSLVRIADGVDADVICFGHVHVPYHRIVTSSTGRTVHFVSDGSVGKPKDGDSRACWALLAVDESGLRVTFNRVEYDGEPVA